MEISGHCYFEDTHISLNRSELADFWHYVHSLLSKLREDFEFSDYFVFNNPHSKKLCKTPDADNFRAFLNAFQALDDAVDKHSQEVTEQAYRWEERRDFWTHCVHAWALGLKPSVLREMNIQEFRRENHQGSFFPDDVSNWKEIAALKTSQGISADDTRQAASAWLASFRKAG